MDITPAIRQFVVTNFYVPQPDTLGDDDLLLESGIIDSTGVLELLGFLESTYGVKVADDEIVPENLDSIARIAAFVSRKAADVELAAGGGSPLGLMPAGAADGWEPS